MITSGCCQRPECPLICSSLRHPYACLRRTLARSSAYFIRPYAAALVSPPRALVAFFVATRFVQRLALLNLDTTLVAALASFEILPSLARGLMADSTAPPVTALASPPRLALSVVARYTTLSMSAPIAIGTG